MSEKKYCLRCGKELKNPQSIELQYGKRCYKIHLLEGKTKEEDMKSSLINEIQFLKMELNFLKKQFRELKISGIPTTTAGPIEKIKKEIKTPEKSQYESNFIVVIKEMKLIFKGGDDFNYHSILKPIEPKTTIEPSPILKEISITN